MKINFLKVLNIQITVCQSGERKTEQAYSVRFYFSITSHYYSETTKPTTN